MNGCARVLRLLLALASLRHGQERPGESERREQFGIASRYNNLVCGIISRSSRLWGAVAFRLYVSGWLVSVPDWRVLEPFFSCALAKVHVPIAGAGTETGSMGLSRHSQPCRKSVDRRVLLLSSSNRAFSWLLLPM